MRVISILASARANGSTSRLLASIIRKHPAKRIDLLDHTIAHYDYSHSPDDDFFGIAELMRDHDVIIFATPVYWYAMSGRMKVFFDRLTDLVSVRKDLGRSLKMKTTCLVASGTDLRLPDGFEVPFRKTSAYLDMNYAGCFYGRARKDGGFSRDVESAASLFGERLFHRKGTEHI